MPNLTKPIILGAAFLLGIIGANANPLPRAGGTSAGPGAAAAGGARQLPDNEVAALPSSDATPARARITLPGVSVIAPYRHPYTSGLGAKASPNGRLKSEHYQAPPDYVMNIAMHPYTSRIGPKINSNGMLRFEHYDVPPDYERDVSKHPYTSSIGPPVEGGRNCPGDLQPTASSHDKR